MSSWQGPPVLVGERALWLGCGSGLPRPGVIKWIGHLPGIGPDWTVGLELDEALPIGGIDGSWGGRVLFTCKSKHGLLVPIANIIPGSQLKHLPAAQSFEKSHNATDFTNSAPILTRKSIPLSDVSQPDDSFKVIQEKGLKRPLGRQKQRIPTPPSSDSEELNLVEDTEAATLRVEEVRQEDSLKKRLRLLTEYNGATQRMNGLYNNYDLQEVVIDSLYAQRHQQFVKHGRSHSESTQAFVSSASSSSSRKERNSTSAIFSIFRWFRKESRSDDLEPDFAPSAPSSPQLTRGLSSSCGSIDTLFSTATASSFAFVHPALYRPFGAANAPEKRILPGPETETYKNRLRQRDKIRELDKNLTLKKKYHLFGSGTLHRSVDNVTSKSIFLNKSLDSLKINEINSENKTSSLNRKKRKAPPPPVLLSGNKLESNKENTNINVNAKVTDSAGKVHRARHRRTVSDSAKDRKSGAFVHVKGKRKAPPPPNKIQHGNTIKPENYEILGTQSLGRKKRPAPLPPLEIEKRNTEENRFHSNSFLSPEEKQKLIENIAKLQAHADRRNLLLLTPSDSLTLGNKMSHTVCNDSLKLEKGVLKANKMEVRSTEAKPTSPTPVSPRPWYKRNNKEKSLEKKKDKNKVDDWMPEVAIARGSIIQQDSNYSTSASNSTSTYRLSNIFSRFDKPEEKRKSQISMLANISELDREAAEIVQQEQEREKAILAAHDAKYYTSAKPLEENFSKLPEREHATVESSSKNEDENIPKRSGARELISLFNALGNVTKVTVNSAFFAREGPSIFTKEGIEKRFLRTSDSVKMSEEKLVTGSLSNVNEYKQESVVIETKETYLESPGIKRRRNLLNKDTEHENLITTSSGSSSPAVVIEEIDESDMEKSKIQTLYEANKIRKHHSPSPSIPAIAEMSESVSSITTSPGSTLNPSDRSASATPTTITSPTVMPVVSTAVSSKQYNVWSCPRCTLENPKWRVTCEACDMWRPVVQHEVVDKLTNANMGTTIAVKEVKTGEAIKNNVESNILMNIEHRKKENIVDPKTKLDMFENKTVLKDNNSSKAVKIERSKPITVSGLLSSGTYKHEELKNLELKAVKPLENIKSSASGYSGNKKLSSNNVLESAQCSSKLNVTPIEKEVKNSILSKNTLNVETRELLDSKSESEMDEVRKARLAFFDKSQTETREIDEINDEDPKVKSSINQAKIDALFSIASKGSLATNEEERLKVKEILKEMKDSLPKRTNKNVSEKNKVSTNTNLVICENDQSANAARLGAIRKTTTQNTPASSSNVKNRPVKNRVQEQTSEIILVKSETIIEEIKMKANNDFKSPKVTTSAQTNGFIRKVEPNVTPLNKEEIKPLSGKPPTPKANRKDIVVPVNVEEHIIRDGEVHTTVYKEPRKMNIGTFELIRPRDFATIEAIKTGNDIKSPLTHVYANVPSTHTEDLSTVPITSLKDGPEINQWTARFSKPKGLADFKAAVLESTAGDKMSTLAVNRLLKQLESAIAGGQHQRAAALAQELAKHKVSCSVTRHQRTNDFIIVDMYVEDKLSHQGPFPLQLSPALTVVELKAKVEREFEIPIAVQRWILGKELAIDDAATLQQLGINKPHCPVFLYLVAPDGTQEKAVNLEVPEIPNENPSTLAVARMIEERDEATGVTQPNRPGRYFNDEDDRYSFCESEDTDHSSKNESPEPRVETVPETSQEEVLEVEEEIEEEDEVEEVEEETDEEDLEEENPGEAATTVATGRDQSPLINRSGTLTTGWKCTLCTLVNPPTRPGCLACAADRPADYSVPPGYEAEAAERVRLDNDLQATQAEADEKRKNYERLMMLEKADLIPTAEPFECSVCLSACAAADGVMLRDCLHIFCRGCLAHTVQYTEDAEVKCPFRDQNYACDSTLQEREIKALVSAEVYEQHLAKSVALAENKIGNAFHCKTPDCPGWCIFEDNVNTFHCPVCDQTNCLTCQVIHTGLDCKQYQEKAQQEVETNADARRTTEMLEEMIQRGEALACPTCQVVLLKKWGCDWLRCSMCKTEICWVTKGPRWGPNGKGDTSGGCQCGVNGIKCHPKCNYCH